MKKTIYFDMDGTLAALFFVKGFKEMLEKEDATPYKIAGTLYKTEEMKEVITNLKNKGYSIGIISYTSKECTKKFEEETIKTKIEWLNKFFPYADEIHIVNPSIEKASFMNSINDILVDDSGENRKKWEAKGGKTINAYFRAKVKMIECLKEL